MKNFWSKKLISLFFPYSLVPSKMIYAKKLAPHYSKNKDHPFFLRHPVGLCRAINGENCKFPFKWMDVVFENCSMVDKADLGWCATEVDPDGSFNTFEFCDGQCSTVPYYLVTAIQNESDCCEKDETCSSVDIHPDVLGMAKISFMNTPLTFVMNVEPNNGYIYKDDKGIEAIFRYFEQNIHFTI